MTQRKASLAELKARIAALDDERAAIAAEIAMLEQPPIPEMLFPDVASSERAERNIDRHSETDQKILLFREIFRGRTDVFPIRWDNAKFGKSGYAPACHNEWQRGVCEKPRVKCSVCPNQAFIEVSDNLIERHLRGTTSTGAPFVMGLYPMLPDGTCHLLVADFDREDWRRDALAYVETCDLLRVPCALERSRSGNGAHAWIFFQEPVPATTARRLGSAIITDTMERVAYRVHDVPHLGLAMPATRTLRRNHGRDDRPFRIRHIARISTFTRRMLNARFLGPHGSPQSLIRLQDTESQQIPRTQELSRQALRHFHKRIASAAPAPRILF